MGIFFSLADVGHSESYAGVQGPYLRSPEHLGRSSMVKE